MKFSDNSLFVAPTPLKLAEELAGWFYSQVFNHSNQSKQYYIAISGGSTPIDFFNYLATYFAQYINWQRIHIFWADERCVPPSNNDSNFKNAYNNFLSKVDIPETNIHRIMGENNPLDERLRYTDEIKKVVPIDEDIPQFDLILLGLGSDGHTASLFPDSIDIIHTNNLVENTRHPVSGQSRITLTPKLINNAKKIVFQVTGFAKAGIVGNILQNKPEAIKYSAYYIKPLKGYLYWFLDTGAAKELFK